MSFPYHRTQTTNKSRKPQAPNLGTYVNPKLYPLHPEPLAAEAHKTVAQGAMVHMLLTGKEKIFRFRHAGRITMNQGLGIRIGKGGCLDSEGVWIRDLGFGV